MSIASPALFISLVWNIFLYLFTLCVLRAEVSLVWGNIIESFVFLNPFNNAVLFD